MSNVIGSVSSLLRRKIRSIGHGLGSLPRHPYEEQFSSELDFPRVAWAKQFYMIASTPRCGSHLLGHMLAQTNLFGMPLEYLNRRNLKHWQRRFGASSVQETFELLVQHRTSKNGVFCVKAHWKQFEPWANAVPDLTRGLGFQKIVWIVRRDQLLQAISYSIAMQTGAWISGSEASARAEYRYEEIVQYARKLADMNLAWKSYLSKEYPNSHIRVIYEDLLLDDTIQGLLATSLKLPNTLRKPKRTQVQGGRRNEQWAEQFKNDLRPQDAWVLEEATWFD